MPLRTVAISPAQLVPSESDIASVRFDGQSLSIAVARDQLSGNQVRGLRIAFKEVQGFRLLDEVDLAQYWEAPNFLPGHHVLLVESGGWSAEEDLRQGYEVQRREWLVVTGNRCLSIFASVGPQIDECAFDAEASPFIAAAGFAAR